MAETIEGAKVPKKKGLVGKEAEKRLLYYTEIQMKQINHYTFNEMYH